MDKLSDISGSHDCESHPSEYGEDTVPPPAYTEDTVLPPTHGEDTTLPPAMGKASGQSVALLDTAHDRDRPPLTDVGHATTQTPLASSERPQATRAHRTQARSSLDQLWPGVIIHKHYELIRELGRGGMGVVYLARDIRLGRLVAIKFAILETEQANQLFAAEARTTARCTHENIVLVYETSEFLGMPFMVLEYLEGKSLKKLIQEYRDVRTGAAQEAQNRLLSPVRSIELMLPVARALERAHSMGIVHRDLKPGNIAITDSGVVKVLDFGIATVNLDREPLLESMGAPASASTGAPAVTAAPEDPAHRDSFAGTLPYMSPEQLGEREIDHRIDIWAFGIILFQMLTGQHPMEPLSLHRFRQIANVAVPMPRIHDVRPDVGQLGHLVDRCLLKPRADRVASAADLVAELERILAGHRTRALAEGQSPFTGLSAFQESDADRFFGRDDDTNSVISRVRNQPLVAIIGPSGSGKSSLVRAGVIPALKRSGEGWESFVLRPGRTPLGELATLLTELTASAMISTDRGAKRNVIVSETGLTSTDDADRDAGFEHQQVAERLRREPGYLGTELRVWAQRKLRRVIIFVDQFEEVYTLCADESERRAFFAALIGVADEASSPLRVALSMRSDFLERMSEDRVFMAAATRGLHLLPPMERQGLRAALEQPLKAIGYKFEDDDMVASMLAELEETRGALPLLQFAATRLWQVRDRQRRLLTRASFDDMGGIAGVLARHADATMGHMTLAQARIARAIFERLVTPERTRAVASMAELRALSGDVVECDYVIQDLADARLLIIEIKSAAGHSPDSILEAADADADAAVEIAHESLITRWPMLRRWLDENQDDAEFLARLRPAAHQWHKSGHDRGMLWGGEVAREAQQWHRRYQGELPKLERRFLEAVTADLRRAVHIRRFVTYGGLITLLIVVGLIALFKIQQLEAINEQRQAEEDKTTALQQANNALKDARDRAVREQKAAERARDEAEQREQEAVVARKEAVAARKEADRARQDTAIALGEVKQKQGEVERALAEARGARAQAETDRNNAELAARDARAAELRARKASRDAKAAAERERRSRAQLQELLKKLGIKEPNPQ